MDFPLIPLEKAFTCQAEGSLDKAFSQTESSHDCVLVYDEEDRFLGAISPSLCLFRNSFRYSTKAKTCLIHPPHITSSTPLSKIAEFMRSCGMYQLPVFQEDGEMLGLVSAQGILRVLLEDKELFSKIALRPDRVLVAPIDSASVHDLYYKIMRGKEDSRVVLVNAGGSVAAIVTRRDIQKFLTKPTNRQRFQSSGPGMARNYLFGTEKEKRLDALARECATRDVLMADERAEPKTLLSRMREKNKNSIVLVGGRDIPVGIISMKSILLALASLQEGDRVQIAVTNNAGLSDGDRRYVEGLCERYARKLAKRSPLMRMDMVVKEAKNTAGRPTEFEITGEAQFFSGKTYVGTAKDRNLMKAARAALERIERQESDSES